MSIIKQEAEIALETIDDCLRGDGMSATQARTIKIFVHAALAELDRLQSALCRALRAAQAAQEDKEKLEQRVKELEQGISKFAEILNDFNGKLRPQAQAFFEEELFPRVADLVALTTPKGESDGS